MASAESLTKPPFEVSRGKGSTLPAKREAAEDPYKMQPTMASSDAVAEVAVQATPNRETNLPPQQGSQLFDVCQYDCSKEPSALTHPASPPTRCLRAPFAQPSAPSSSSPVPPAKMAETPEPPSRDSQPLSRQSPSPTPRDQESTPGLQPPTNDRSSAGVAGQILQTPASQESPAKVDYTDFSAKVVPSAGAGRSASTSVPGGVAQIAACQSVDDSGTLPPKRAHSEDVLSQTIGSASAKKTILLTESVSKEQQLSVAAQRSPSPRVTGNEEERFRSFDKMLYIHEAAKGIVSLESTQSGLSIGPIDMGIFTSTYAPPNGTDPSVDQRGFPGMPWATVVVILLQLLAHWKYLLEHHPERRTSVNAILKEGRWEGLAFAAFHHEHAVHITSNVVCFLFKGLVLEAALGTTHFVHVFAVVVFLVGLVNAAIVQYLHSITSVASLQEMDLSTFAGVAVALELLHRKRFPNATADVMLFEIRARPVVLVLCELFILWMSSSRNFLPTVSGLLVGFLLAGTSAGEVICAPSPRRQLNLSAITRTPVTCLLVACICVTHLLGPFSEPSAAEEPTLVFRGLFKQPSIPRALYVGNVYHLVYIVLSLLAVDHNLERTLGRRRFSGLLAGLLFSVSVFGDVLSVVNWKRMVAIRSDSLHPEAVAHTGDCCCTLVGAMLALKAIHHTWRPRSGYLMASFPINLPFWPGLLLELAHLHLNTHDGASFSHVTGALLGLATAHLWRGHLLSCNTEATSSTSRVGRCRGVGAGLTNAPNEHYD